MKPRLLDLFCKAGGSAMGYYNAGFEVVGIDKEPQPHYPFEFHLADALTYPLEGFDAYHASPPCQGYSCITKTSCKTEYPKLIRQMRERFIGKLSVIENVQGAKSDMVNPLMLCGTMFGLPIHRHRYFELSFDFYPLLPPCGTDKQIQYITGKHIKRGQYIKEPNAAKRRECLQTPWMTIGEMDEAIPPAFTEYLGKILMQIVINNRSIVNA